MQTATRPPLTKGRCSRVLVLVVVTMLATGCSETGATHSASPVASSTAAATGTPFTTGSTSPASASPTTPASPTSTAGSEASPTPAPPSPHQTSGWHKAGTMHLAHAGGSVLRLGDGRILVVGNSVFDSYRGDTPDNTTRFAELWDPGTRSWRVETPLGAPRDLIAAVVLRDGRAMVIGGMNAAGASYSSCYIFDPSTDAWVKTGLLGTARYGAAATVLQDGRVLVVGGRYSTGMGDHDGRDVRRRLQPGHRAVTSWAP